VKVFNKVAGAGTDDTLPINNNHFCVGWIGDYLAPVSIFEASNAPDTKQFFTGHFFAQLSEAGTMG
jgi:hypothetical protein